MNRASGRPTEIDFDSLPSVPPVAMRVVSLCVDPDVELAGLSAAVSLDPVLSARILRTANSAAFNWGAEVISLDKAMMLMGIKLVKLTALGLVISSSLSGLPKDDEIVGQVWHQCLVRAVACRELAQLARLPTAPESWLFGLFDGMGHLLAMATNGTAFRKLLRLDPFPDVPAQRAVLGMSTNELVRTALRAWGVPELYARVLEDSESDDSGFDDSEVGRLAAVLVASGHATSLLLGHPTRVGCVEEALAALGLDMNALDAISVDLGEHVGDLATAMGIDLGDSMDFPGLLGAARDQLIQMSIQIAEESMLQSLRIHDLEGQQAGLRRSATTDQLTGLPNRASFDEMLDAAVQDRISGRVRSGALGVAMIDIDHFKRVNDTYGHQAGDRVLEAVGRALSSVTRSGDTIARYGGEEFVLVLPNVESAEGLEATAERIRRVVSELEIDSGSLTLTVTVSVGAIASSVISGPEAAGALLEAADRLLYQAKNAGRNLTFTDFTGVAIDRD